MMKQSTQTNNYERPKNKVGRPTGTASFTDDENNEQTIMISILYYSSNVENEREMQQLQYQATHLIMN